MRTAPPPPATTAPRPTTRRPSVPTITQVLARDRTCTFPGCGVPAFRCDLVHVLVPGVALAPELGPADLVALCRRHQVVRARDGWQPAVLDDGTVRWTAPSGHTYRHAAGTAGLSAAESR
ncbi:hypothetical protein IF650_03135 [Cellulosimicrobium terreum]|nr:hypothetical protein [Cellulosimicrobium terreum]